jgi:Na+-translocating ferredoxin:NAD+ oxidoreductase subunit B
MKMNDDIYHSLQKRIDALPIAFPKTKSGVELRLLRHLFNEEEAAVACELSALGEPISKIHKRAAKNGLSYTSRELKRLFNGLLKKGAITGDVMKTKKGVERSYSLLPLAIGMFEMQVDNLTEEYTRDFEEYLDGGFGDAMVGTRTGQLRTIPVGTAIESANEVSGYDDIKKFVDETKGPFGVMNCVCRQGKDLLNESCDHSDIRETCLTIGSSAVGMSRRGNARLVGREEFLELLDRAEKKGFVLQARNTKEPGFICCCCGDCCEILVTAKKLPRPAEAFHTNFFAQVDGASCNGCGRCVSRCQMDAIRIAESPEGKTAIVNLDRCIGCGLCVTTCPTGSLSLPRKRKTIVPPRSSTTMFVRMYIERLGLFGAAAVGVKYLLKRKI